VTLKAQTLSGLFWSFLSQGGKQASQFVITAILARLVSPADFGLLGMATVFTGFALIFGELGIGGAIVQKQDLRDEHYSSAFWLNILVGSCLTGLFVLLAPLIASFFGTPELRLIVVVLSLNFFLSSFTVVQQAILTKAMHFRTLMVRDLGAVILSGVVGIVCAMRGLGVWSLVAQTLTYTIVNNFLLWMLSSWRPQFAFSRAAIGDIFHFSANMTGFQIVNYLARNVDHLIIGKFLGAQALGYYTLAYKLMMLPLQNSTWVINKVMFPAFSRIQDQLEKVQENYLKLLKAVALLVFPGMALFHVLAPDLVSLVYGHRWQPAVALIEILCFCGMAQSISSLGGIIYLSQGKADVQLKMSLVSASLLSVILLSVVTRGLGVVSLAYTLFYVAWMNVSLYVVARMIRLRVMEVYRKLLPPLLLSGAMLLVTGHASPLLSGSMVWRIGLLSLLGTFVFLVLAFLFQEFRLERGRRVRIRDIV
jgi:O-antigen/teichoic acid export membrane protein